jgi:hypothetical protein
MCLFLSRFDYLGGVLLTIPPRQWDDQEKQNKGKRRDDQSKDNDRRGIGRGGDGFLR